MGRLPIIATLEELDSEALIRILTEPRNALTKQYSKMFEMEGVEIDFRDDALQAVALRAMERKTGARGLRSILEGILLESMYTIPSQPDVAKIVVDESVVTGDSEPLLVYETPCSSCRRRGISRRLSLFYWWFLQSDPVRTVQGITTRVGGLEI